MTHDQLTAEGASTLLGTVASRNAFRLWDNPSGVAGLIRRRLDLGETDGAVRMARESRIGWAGDWPIDDTAVLIARRALRKRGLPGVTRAHCFGMGLQYLRGKITVPLCTVIEEDEFVTPRVAGLQALTVDGDPGSCTSSGLVLPTAGNLVSIAGPGDMDPDGGIIVAPTPLEAIRWRCDFAHDGGEAAPTVVSVAGKTMSAEQARQIGVLARGGSIVLGSASSPWDNDDPLAWDSDQRAKQFLRVLKETGVSVELAQIPATEEGGA